MDEEDSVSDDVLAARQEELEELLGEPVAAMPASPARIERIVERASYETVVKDTTSFLFQGFASAFAGIAATLLGARGVAQIPVRDGDAVEGTTPSEETPS